MKNYTAFSNFPRFALTALVVGILALLALALAPTPAEAGPRATNAMVTSPEVREVQIINNYRRKRGLRALRIDGTLTRAAAWKSFDMASKGYFSHTDSLGRSPFDMLRAFGYPTNSWRGENLAAGNTAPYETFKQWRNSPGHNANMLNRRYTVIGIGRVCRAASRYNCYWTTTFGSKFTKAASYVR